MTPLQWPAYFRRPLHGKPDAAERTSWVARLIQQFTEPSDYDRVRQDIGEVLSARPRPDPGVWGTDPARIRTGLTLCRKIQEEYEWPNDHFIPEDPFDIAMLIPWDDLEIVELMLALEESLQFPITNEEANLWVGSTLGSVTDHLLTLQHKHALSTSQRPA